MVADHRPATDNSWFNELNTIATIKPGKVLRNLQFDFVVAESADGDNQLAAMVFKLKQIIAGVEGIKLHQDARRIYRPEDKPAQYRKTIYLSKLQEDVDLSALEKLVKKHFSVYTKTTGVLAEKKS